jgi:geranylgeranyl diphosphate synthase type II
MNLPAFFEEDRAAVDAALDRLMPAENAVPASVHTAMRYSVQAGGKRVRPILCLEAARIISADLAPVLPVACALEFIHTYSLIHDDLPALDNDDLRRGKPTCHKKFGEAAAILAGDALLTLAFETLANAPIEPARCVAILSHVAASAGTVNGMVGGQVADLEAEGRAIDAKELEYIHRSKTAALIRASLVAGAIGGGADDENVARLHRFGETIGNIRGAWKNGGERRRAKKSDVSRALRPGKIAPVRGGTRNPRDGGACAVRPARRPAERTRGTHRAPPRMKR